MHGYFNRTIKKGQKLDHKTSKSRTKNRKLTSHFERYVASIQEQKIPTKYLINKRARDAGKERPFGSKCRLCKTNAKDVIHIKSCCPFMSARYYLPMRHDVVATTLYKEIIKKATRKLKFQRKSMNKSTYKKQEIMNIGGTCP